MRKLSITATGESAAIDLYPGPNVVTAICTGTVVAPVKVDGITIDLPSDVSDTVDLRASTKFTIDGPGRLNLNVTTLSGEGANIQLKTERSY
jgi:hypothetical protein